MRTYSRRDFFSLNLKNDVELKKNAELKEVIIGRLFDFPPGERTLISSLNITIESLPEGLRAQSSENLNHYYSLKENQAGELVLNRLELWPPSRVYSILLNGPTDLKIASWEDQS